MSEYVYTNSTSSDDFNSGVSGVYSGGSNAGAGASGVGDAWNPHGMSNPFSGFVISGVPVNQDPVNGGVVTANAVNAHYYSGYWAGVQGAMYGFGGGVGRSSDIRGICPGGCRF